MSEFKGLEKKGKKVEKKTQLFLKPADNYIERSEVFYRGSKGVIYEKRWRN